MLQETVHISRWANLPKQVPIRPLVGAEPVHGELHITCVGSKRSNARPARWCDGIAMAPLQERHDVFAT